MPVLALITGCGDDPTGPDVAGEYELVRANGEPLPALVYDSVVVDDDDNEFPYQVHLDSGELSLSGGDYEIGLVVDVVLDGDTILPDESLIEDGTYSVHDGGTIRFTSSDGGEESTGSVNGDEISLTETSEDYGSFTLLFRR
ncbi:MAG: hypothetical protein ACODAE_07080 [Gemmatimonadota bacterium]